MTMPKLTKEQIEVVNHNDGNILVSASAGSGKTHTMIERLKRLIIQKGVSVNQILAVTFTESAASDMKEKLKKALTDVVNGNYDEKSYGVLSLEKIKECERQILEIGTADISTMHAFCGRIIRSYFFEVGTSPDFKILDEADANVLRAHSIEKTFKQFYDEGEEWFLRLVDRHAVTRADQNIKDLVLSAYSFCDSESNPTEFADKFLEVYSKEGFYQLLTTYKSQLNHILELFIERANACLQVFVCENLTKGCEFTSTLIADMQAIINNKDIYSIKSLQDYKLGLNFERKLSETAKENKEIIANIRQQFIKTLKRFNNYLSTNEKEDFDKMQECKIHTQDFVKVIKRFSEIYWQEKREENALDFNDLEHFALQILGNNQIAKEVAGKYKYIFIDEYQDTNGVQEEIISKISNQNVFMVGDVKQSIYGFRGCRSEFFTNKDALMSKNGEKVVRLNHNFRSADAVINCVNQIFNYCMTDAIYGENYKEKSKLIGGGIYPEEYKGRAQLHFLHKEERKQKEQERARVYDLLEENPQQTENQAKTTAMMIANIIYEERTKKYYNPKQDKILPVGYGDIVILTRNKNNKYVNDLVSGLIQCGIPVSSDVAENVCDYPEIKVMINALKLIDCFLQDLPLVSTLKSPIGNFSEEQLFEIARFYDDNALNNHGGFSDAYAFYLKNAQTQLSIKLKAFDDYFNKLREVADFIGAHGALSKLILDSKMEAYLYAQPLGEDKVDRLKRFVSASVLAGKNLTVKEFLSRIKACPNAFALSPFASENTVKIMTIHASKGLEFPVVITCGLERNFNAGEDYDEVMQSRNYGFAFMHYDDKNRVKSQTVLRGVIRERNRIERMKEEMRLLYVALTRATYSLHIAFMGEDDYREDIFTGAEKFVDFVPQILNATEHDKASVQIKSREVSGKHVIIVKPDENIVNKMQQNFSYSYPFALDCYLPLKSSVTALNKDGQDEVVYTHVLFDEQSPDTQSGTIAHKILENYDFDCDKPLSQQVALMIEKNIISKEDCQRLNLQRIENAIVGLKLNGAKNKRLYREKSFLVNIPAKMILDTQSCENVLVQGVIDLLIIDGDSAEIVDYKYSSLTQTSLVDKYKKQLDLYAYAVEKVLDKKVMKKTLLNIFTGESVQV